MTELPPKVLSWLHNVLLGQEYHDVNRAFSDVAHTLAQQSTLRPQTNVYRAFENGHSALLLHLAGTIPVQFRGTLYSFPVSLWVPHAYPREAPIAFVTPTREVAVRPGQHVSGEGRIYHPYLANWRPDRSNLDELLRILQDVFSREPPVVSKQDITARLHSLSIVSGGENRMPPLPRKPGQSTPAEERPRLYPSTSGQPPPPPPPPPKPFQNHDIQKLSQQSKPPPVPPRPSSMSEQLWPSSEAYGGQSSQQYQIVNQYAPQRQSSLRNEHYKSAQPDQVQLPSCSYSQRQGLATSQQTPALASSNQDLTTQQRYQQPLLPPVPGARYPSSAAYTNQLHPHQPYHQPLDPYKYPPYQTYNHAPPALKPPPPADLLSSPLDITLLTQPQSSDIPAPPIPPNPQKDALFRTLSRTLTQTLHDSLAHNASLLLPLRAQHQALQSSLTSLQQEHQSLTALSVLLTSNESILHKAMRDADKVIAEAQHRTVPPVDEVLVAPTVVGEQLYELVAEERACVEARGVLARALDRGRVGVEVWVRVSRGVAREEFLKKVLVRKCASGLGLSEGEEW